VRAAVLALVLASCAPGPPAGPSACGGHAQLGITTTFLPTTNEVDLLFVVDSSPAMAGHERHVHDQIARLVEIVASGDATLDGVRDWYPPDVVHVAVVTTDAGTSPFTDHCSADGDDGAFRTRSADPLLCIDDLGGAYPDGVLTFHDGRDDPHQFAGSVACVASAGSGGCAFDRGMDAIRRGLDAMHGPGLPGEGVLGIVVITAGDDCSASDPTLYSEDASVASVPLGRRCDTFAARLAEIEDTADAILAARSSPSLIVLSVVSGIPTAVEGRDPAVVLADPAMALVADPADATRLAAACVSSDGARATPAVRWTRLVQSLEARGAGANLVSICSATFDRALEMSSFGTELRFGICLPRPLRVDAEGRVPCDLMLALPLLGTTTRTVHCSELESPEAYELDHIEVATDPFDLARRQREICRVQQLPRGASGSDAGWRYDDGSSGELPADCEQGISLRHIQVDPNVEARLLCDEILLPATDAAAQLHTACDPETGMTDEVPSVSCTIGRAAENGGTLACDAFARSCELPCATDADCAAGGLPGYACDLRDANTFFDGGTPAGIDPTAARAFCVDLTCVEPFARHG
jgi:hypothetical protein